jgi:predicted dehydrogenase
MGTADVNTALQVPGVKLVAVCDLYDARIAEAGKWGDGIFTTKNYLEILDRDDIDAVIVATPDHWHVPVSLDALKAGKHVYCEKPVIHKISEGRKLLDTQKNSGVKFQAGSQGMASLGNRKARQLVGSGIIGKVNFIDGLYTGAPNNLMPFRAPDGANEKTIWWERFLGTAPERPFDAQRFFQWRNWMDYGTGNAGDLFVHVLSSIQFIMNAAGPEKIYSTGGIRHQTNGTRDTPDVLLGYYDYPDTGLGAFTIQVGANYVDGVSKKWGSADFNIIGAGGRINVGWDTVTLESYRELDMNLIKDLEADPVGGGIDKPEVISAQKVVFKAAPGYKGGHWDHFNNFFTGIRNDTPLVSDALFGVRAAMPALLGMESYYRGEVVRWDPVNMKEIQS